MAECTQINELSVWVPVFSALGGAALMFIGNSINNYFNRKHDLRKLKIETVVNAAVTQYKAHMDFAKATTEKVSIDPFDIYILHMAKMADLYFEPSSNATNISERIRVVNNFTKKAKQVYVDMK